MTQESRPFIAPLPNHVSPHVESTVGGREGAAGDVYAASVGEMVQCVARANEPILSVLWVITGGNPVAGYTVTQGLGEVVPLPAGALQQNPLTFAFTVAGTWTVQAYFWTPSGFGHLTETYEVRAPQVNFFESETAQVGVHLVDGSPWLMFGTPGAPGITMNAVLFGQQTTAGQVGILQLAIDERYGTDAEHRPYHNSQNGLAALDVGPGGAYTFYQGVIESLPVGGNAQIQVTDRPGQELGPPLTFVSIGDGTPVIPERYQAFLMFCATSPGAIWVPLSVLSWSWEGCTTLTGNAWGPVQDPGNAVNPAGVPTDQFPQWNLNTTTGGWVPG